MIRAHSRRLIFLLSIAVFLLLGTRLFSGRSLLLLPEAVENASRHQDDSQNAAHVPGIFEPGQSSGNTSACTWNHELPISLSNWIHKIVGTPETKMEGAYRVLPFIIRGETKSRSGEYLPQLTLCTHATADQVYHVVEIVKRWEGPVSLAVYAPGEDAGLAVDLLEQACRYEPEMNKLSVHLVFPVDLLPSLSTNCHFRRDCGSFRSSWSGPDTERKRRGMIYPINVARNVARSLATTSRVLVSDIELLPSAQLASSFLEMINDRPPTIGLVFVVPVFEIEEYERLPTNKRELIAAIRAGRAVYFHKYVCIHCQRFPGITRWMLRPDPGRVRPLIVTRREYPHHRWEPVYIGTRLDPLYNEALSWEGQQDKMAQMLEMCLMNYRLIVLDGAFLVHTPGIKKKFLSVNSTTRSFSRTQEKRNAQIYQMITQRLLKKYPSNPRCRQ